MNTRRDFSRKTTWADVFNAVFVPFQAAFLFILCFLFAVSDLRGQQQERLDLSVAQKIKQEEMKNSDVERLSYLLMDLAGPRLAGSEGMERGYQVAEEIMRSYHLSNPRIEFGSEWLRGGWDVHKVYACMTVPYYIPIPAAPVGWTDGTDGIVKGKAELVTATTFEELNRLKGTFKGKIVLVPSTLKYVINFAPLATRHTEESLKQIVDYPLRMSAQPPLASAVKTLTNRDIVDFLREEEAAVILNANGEFGVPGITFYRLEQTGKHVPCELNIPLENHGQMVRLIMNGEEVQMEIEVRVTFEKNKTINNVIAEIPGVDPKLKDQLVIIGAHLDCYPFSPGAGDDAAGCITMLEAMRILKAIDIKPRRTIRICLWGGEELGLYGSSGYVRQFVMDMDKDEKKKEYDKISAYFNSDYGPGKFRGIYTQDNIQVNHVFREWLQPFTDMGVATVSNKSVGSTDHIPFDRAGIPAFQFIQDNMEWGRHSHKMQDFPDRIVLDDLRSNAVIMAWFAYCAAMRDEMLPRKQ